MSDLPQRLRLNATIPLVMESADRIEKLEAALREISILWGAGTYAKQIARAALAPEPEK